MPSAVQADMSHGPMATQSTGTAAGPGDGQVHHAQPVADDPDGLQPLRDITEMAQTPNAPTRSQRERGGESPCSAVSSSIAAAAAVARYCVPPLAFNAGFPTDRAGAAGPFGQ